jgi:predicted transport protein
MPFFGINENKLSLIKSTNFTVEKKLQNLIENNLETVFNCKFIASEFHTGVEHSGRIDTLALSEDKNPVIIEYKNRESSKLITQSLSYLSWIDDHKGDFQIAVNKMLDTDIIVDWSEIRVICLAPGYKKHDLQAVKVLRGSIELWQYRLLENKYLHVEEVFRKSNCSLYIKERKNPLSVREEKKDKFTSVIAEYTIEQHLKNIDINIKCIAEELRDYILSLDNSIAEVPNKFYIAYKSIQNFVCLQTTKSKILLFLKLNPKEIQPFPSICRDVTTTGHYGTGDLEVTLKDKSNISLVQDLIERSYRNIGG